MNYYARLFGIIIILFFYAPCLGSYDSNKQKKSKTKAKDSLLHVQFELELRKGNFYSVDTLLLKYGYHEVYKNIYRYGIVEYLFSSKKNTSRNAVKVSIVVARFRQEDKIARDLLLFYKVFNENHKKRKTSDYIDSINIVKIIHRYSSIGLNQLKVNDAISYYKVDFNIFGFGCGFSGAMPYWGQELLLILRRKNTIELTNWLSSINPTKIAYGYLGLQVLLKQGAKFTQIQYDLIKTFEDDKFRYNTYTFIETCSGCMYGEIYSLVELTESEFFTRMIENYSRKIK